ncbi:ribose-phosphate diphosphokinase [Haloplasma contractile]|uniref:Ribose-phosphate pyrophosphokinase n=1 Tax=Haloplasma contractile SSD-17B TaxID=1033810 RepID=U2DVT1_9MOLU|nr:ribose-phosphate diphosphokinase [Haloplasma contractile]ERJ12462.1 Ribose-phosphate pyrophosphokinase 1 protein [Haloplasma contractile SSD-17B]
MLINNKKVKLFSLNSNPQLAEEVSDYTGIPLSKCHVERFADGEVSIDIEETVRGHHVFVVQPTNAPVNENLMTLLIMIDALKRASARTINVIMPYYGYSRQDRKARARQPISAKLVADLLQAAGAARVLSMDLHASQIQGFFNIPIDNFVALPSITKYFLDKKFEKDIVVVSPDHGGATRARKLAEYLQAPIAIIDKRRPKPNVAEVMNVIGEVNDKVAIIIDDMIDTAGSITSAATALKDRGAVEVYAAATHPILSGPAIKRLTDSVIEEVVVTNTIALPEEKQIKKIVQLSIGQLLGQGVLNIIYDKSVSELFKVDNGVE